MPIKDPVKKAEYDKARYAANKETISAHQKEYYAANKETVLAQKKEYYAANKETISAQKKGYYAANRETTLAQQKEYAEKYPERRMLRSSKHSAKLRGLEHNITLPDIVVPEFCPVLGIRLNSKRRGGRQPDTPSLDRIDSSKGYIKGNVRVISWRANRLKADATLEESRLLYEDSLRIANQ